jgi:hypothetical protein
MVFYNDTFNNISVMSWRSVLLVEETGEKTDFPQVTDKLYHCIEYTSPWAGFELTTVVAIGTDCLGSCKSNYHTIMTTMPLTSIEKIEIHSRVQKWKCSLYQIGMKYPCEIKI